MTFCYEIILLMAIYCIKYTAMKINSRENAIENVNSQEIMIKIQKKDPLDALHRLFENGKMHGNLKHASKELKRLRNVYLREGWNKNRQGDIQKRCEEEVFDTINESISKKASFLPHWMSSIIYNDFKKNNIVLPEDIEIFLIKQLKKNFWKIKISHIKNRFWDNSDVVLKYLQNLFLRYSEFSIIYDQTEELGFKSQNKKTYKSLIFTDINVVGWSNDSFLSNLKDKLLNIDSVPDIQKRVQIYTEIIETYSKQRWYTIDKRNFASTLMKWFLDLWAENALKKRLRIMLENWQWWEWPTERYGYWRIKVDWTNNWRIVAYPNKEIVAFLWHDDYIRFITSRPNSDKR